CRSMLGVLDGAFAAFDEALEWGGNEPLARLRDATWRTILLSELGRFQEALDVAVAGAALARDLGLSGWLDELSLESVEAHLGLGNLTAAETLLDQLDPLNMAPYERAYATARRVELLLWRDEAEAAASLYRGARDLLNHVRGGDLDDDLELSRV